MKLLDEYFKIQKQIYDYFDYKEDWVIFPIDDATEYFWMLFDNNSVRFAETEEKLIDKNNDEEYGENEIYTQRFLPRSVYRTEDYTMICVDTCTDGNKFLQIFDNSKEINCEL